MTYIILKLLVKLYPAINKVSKLSKGGFAVHYIPG